VVSDVVRVGGQIGSNNDAVDSCSEETQRHQRVSDQLLFTQNFHRLANEYAMADLGFLEGGRLIL